MGNCFSIQVSGGDALLNRCWDCTAGQAAYICQLEHNLQSLKAARDELIALKGDVVRRVSIKETQPRKQRLEQVQQWISAVEAKVDDVDELISTGPEETEKLCLGGCCSNNCRSSYLFGKNVARRLKDVVDLRTKGLNFNKVTELAPSDPVVERPSESTVGLEIMLEKVWRCLMEEETRIMGLFGMGGVGKTTLLTQINNKFHRNTEHDFNLVVWVVVSKDLNLDKIQHDIGERLGLSNEKWKKKSLDRKAEDIHQVMSRKKFVLLMDDIWEPVDLVKVGIPLQNTRNGSKLIFTTRSETVCGHMRAQPRVKMEPLPWVEAWKLFLENVGEDTINVHPDLLPMAHDIVRECSGLPLSLITLGRAMACKVSPEEWSYAVELFRSSASEIEGMEDKVFTILKHSYDNLSANKFRSCFLYCALFPEDFKILKEDLVDYWICEKFWDNEDRIGSRNEGYNIVGTLVRACLLEENGEYVKMHDVIRDMALWIACKRDKEKENFVVHAGSDLVEVPKGEEWKWVRRVSLMNNEIEKLSHRPSCSDLLTLFLGYNPSLFMITVDFFQCMDALTVLDLSNSHILKLPREISKLVSLEYLNLSFTWIEGVPLELRMLVKLKYLNVGGCHRLRMIPRQVISNLSLLHVLKMYDCVGYGGVEDDDKNIMIDGEKVIEEVECLKHLNVLTINISGESAFKRFLGAHALVSCTQCISVGHLGHSKLFNISFLENMRKVQFGGNDFEELINVENDMVRAESRASSSLPNSAISRVGCFNNLREVTLVFCRGLRDLTLLVTLSPNLTLLSVASCVKLEEIVNIEKLSESGEKYEDLNPFAKLEFLQLHALPQLRSIYWNALPLQFLQRIEVGGCPKLKKLPLNSESAKGCKVVIKGLEDWWKNIEWENDDAKAAFSSCFMAR